MKMSPKGRALTGAAIGLVFAAGGETALAVGGGHDTTTGNETAYTSQHTGYEALGGPLRYTTDALGACSITGATRTLDGKITINTVLHGQIADIPRASVLVGKNTWTQLKAVRTGADANSANYAIAYDAGGLNAAAGEVDVNLSNDGANPLDVANPYPYGVGPTDLIDCGRVDLGGAQVTSYK
ncbi:MAG TPA: hypothetical protein VGO07_02840 [Candidatus Saccharimonadales bacterium]|jgi:hypothetical protein|nr:hypothetical protein [Candidatus Saccharimonadales bacterium]